MRSTRVGCLLHVVRLAGHGGDAPRALPYVDGIAIVDPPRIEQRVPVREVIALIAAVDRFVGIEFVKAIVLHDGPPAPKCGQTKLGALAIAARSFAGRRRKPAPED